MDARFAGLTVVLAATCGCTSQIDLPVPPPPPAESAPFIPLPAGPDTFVSALSVSRAEEILLATDVFSYGFASARTDAYIALMSQPDRSDRFRAIAVRARWAGQLYALCALSAMSDSEAETVAARLTNAAGFVLVYQQHVAEEKPIADVARLIRDTRLWRDLQLLVR